MDGQTEKFKPISPRFTGDNKQLFKHQTKHRSLCLYSIKEPCIISKRLNEKFRSCILQLLYIIQLFQILGGGGDAINTYHISNYYFKTSEIRQKFKNSPIVKKGTSCISFILQKIPVLFQNDWMNTIGGDAFYSYSILYHYFKNFQNSPQI